MHVLDIGQDQPTPMCYRESLAELPLAYVQVESHTGDTYEVDAEETRGSDAKHQHPKRTVQTAR